MNNFDEYKRFVKELLYYFNPMKTEQLEIALCKYFANINRETAKEILFKCQGKRAVMMSSDGWAMSRGKYLQLTSDSKFDRLTNGKYTILPDMQRYVEDNCDLALINCLWVWVDMLPFSMDFSLTHKPFKITFTNSKKKLFEIMYISEIEEMSKIEMIKLLPSDLFDDSKDTIRRVIILENEDSYTKIPSGKGIRYIVTLDHFTKTHYRIVEKREDIWDE